MNNQKFWKKRAEKYNKLNWVNEPEYIHYIIKHSDLKKTDYVLDVGTGTGVIANAVAPLVKNIVGLDISKDMAKQNKWKDNKYFIVADIKDIPCDDNRINKVIARMVFHHITEDTQKAMDECYRVLKKGGKMILVEGVPPHHSVRREYEEIFKLKEDRLVFDTKDLINLMKYSGFNTVDAYEYKMKRFSVSNWLINSGLSKTKQKKILRLHFRGSANFKRNYNMKVMNGECLIDVKYVIVVGTK